MAVEFKISEDVLTRIAVGAAKKSFDVSKSVGIRIGKAALFRSQKIEVETPDFTSYLGTPIFDPFRFDAGQFNELGNVIGPPQGFDQLIIPSAIIEVTQSKNIIATAIQGRNGTVKQFVSDGDFSITISGVIIGKNEGNKVVDIGNVYPDDDVKRLITICKVPDVLTITSTFLNDVFSIFQVVITDYNIPQKLASRDTQPFQISMLSDTPIDLNELEPIKVINITTIVPSEPIVIIE